MPPWPTTVPGRRRGSADSLSSLGSISPVVRTAGPPGRALPVAAQVDLLDRHARGTGHGARAGSCASSAARRRGRGCSRRASSRLLAIRSLIEHADIPITARAGPGAPRAPAAPAGSVRARRDGLGRAWRSVICWPHSAPRRGACGNPPRIELDDGRDAVGHDSLPSRSTIVAARRRHGDVAHAVVERLLAQVRRRSAPGGTRGAGRRSRRAQRRRRPAPRRAWRAGASAAGGGLRGRDAHMPAGGAPPPPPRRLRCERRRAAGLRVGPPPPAARVLGKRGRSRAARPLDGSAITRRDDGRTIWRTARDRAGVLAEQELDHRVADLRDRRGGRADEDRDDRRPGVAQLAQAARAVADRQVSRRTSRPSAPARGRGTGRRQSRRRRRGASRRAAPP